MCLYACEVATLATALPPQPSCHQTEELRKGGWSFHVPYPEVGKAHQSLYVSHEAIRHPLHDQEPDPKSSIQQQSRGLALKAGKSKLWSLRPKPKREKPFPNKPLPGRLCEAWGSEKACEALGLFSRAVPKERLMVPHLSPHLSSIWFCF